MEASQVPMSTAEESAIEGFLRILEEHRRACESSGKYIEAEVAKNRILELRADHENKKREALRAQQSQERLTLENVQILEFEQFKTRWARALQEFDDKAAEQTNECKERHSREMIQVREKNAGEMVDIRPKFSKEILNLRKIQETLARQKEYVEAQKVKVKVDQLEAIELEKAKGMKREQVTIAEEKVLAKQALELEAVLKRLLGAREDLLRQKHMEQDKLLQRHANARSLLEKQQASDRQKMEKQIKGLLLPPNSGHPLTPLTPSKNTSQQNPMTRSIDSLNLGSRPKTNKGRPGRAQDSEVLRAPIE